MKLIHKNVIYIENLKEEEKDKLISFFKKEATLYVEDSYTWYSSKFSFFKNNKEEIFFSRGLINKFKDFCKKENLIIEEEVFDYKENNKIEINSKIKKLRTFQEEITKALELFDSGYVIVPTGGWKTVIMINEIIKRKTKTLVIVNNKNLMYQFKTRLLEMSDFKEENVWIYWDWKKEEKEITIALMQSLWKLSEEQIKKLTSNFDLVFLDECHHLTAKTLLKITLNISSKYVYGLTATPKKVNGLSEKILEKVIWPLVFQVTEERLQKEGYILKPTLIPIVNKDSFVLDFYLDFYKLDEGIKEKKYYANQFLENWIEFNEEYLNLDWPTIILCKNKKELNLFVQKLKENLKSLAWVIEWNLYKGMSNAISKSKLIIALDIPEEKKKVSMIKIKRELYYRPSRIILINKIIFHIFKNNKDPYILILSDTIEHLEFIFNHLHKDLKKEAILFHWDLKTKEKKEREKDILNKKYRIILAIDKFVWEGWDVPFLNTLVITHLMKDSEGLKQLAGRIMRINKEGNPECKIYDIVDINNPITLSQFKKRFFNYYKEQTNYDWNKIKNIVFS